MNRTNNIRMGNINTDIMYDEMTYNIRSCLFYKSITPKHEGTVSASMKLVFDKPVSVLPIPIQLRYDTSTILRDDGRLVSRSIYTADSKDDQYIDYTSDCIISFLLVKYESLFNFKYKVYFKDGILINFDTIKYGEYHISGMEI